MTDIPKLNHKRDCPKPELEAPFRGRLGDVLIGCRGCSAFRRVGKDQEHLFDVPAEPTPRPRSEPGECIQCKGRCQPQAKRCRTCSIAHEEAQEQEYRDMAREVFGA